MSELSPAREVVIRFNRPRALSLVSELGDSLAVPGALEVLGRVLESSSDTVRLAVTAVHDSAGHELRLAERRTLSFVPGSDAVAEYRSDHTTRAVVVAAVVVAALLVFAAIASAGRPSGPTKTGPGPMWYR